MFHVEIVFLLKKKFTIRLKILNEVSALFIGLYAHLVLMSKLDACLSETLVCFYFFLVPDTCSYITPSHPRCVSARVCATAALLPLFPGKTVSVFTILQGKTFRAALITTLDEPFPSPTRLMCKTL